MWKKAAAGPLPRLPVRVVPRRTVSLGSRKRDKRGGDVSDYRCGVVSVRETLLSHPQPLPLHGVCVLEVGYLTYTQPDSQPCGPTDIQTHTKEVEVSFRVR